MKKILLILIIFLLGGCTNNPVQKANENTSNGVTEILTIDSCEYITWSQRQGASIIHKQNCKFCIERAKSSNHQITQSPN